MRPLNKTLAAALLAFLAQESRAEACLWDTDTLQVERQRFPEALELIVGYFPRHSRAFYQWRIQDRIPRLSESPETAPLYDDLAVAYEKIGNHANAIFVMGKLESIAQGRYETYANLGTFYLHSGDFENGIAFIDKALQINPKAHFGREKYQRYLAEYAASRMKDGVLELPLRTYKPEDLQHESYSFLGTRGFAAFLKDQKKVEPDAAALKGVLGMMRFGDYRSPILLEALGDLLLANMKKDAKLLAGRAFLSASHNTTDARVAEVYRFFAKNALFGQVGSGSHTPLTLTTQFSKLETALQKERDQSDALVAKIEADEKQWIEEGKDADKEFERKYKKLPALTPGG